MSDFYTNVQLIKNNIYYIGYEDGQRIQRKFEFQPTLYLTSKIPSEWKTLTGQPVKEFKQDSVSEAKAFIERYKDVENTSVYGYDRYLYQFISQEFPDEVDYDVKQLKIMSLDIEVECENGFPNVQECAESMLSICMQDYHTRKITLFGTRPYLSLIHI